MAISRDDSRWPEAIHRATDKVLREGAMGIGHRTRVLATWLEGPWLNVVYARTGDADIYYGFRWNTYRGMTGTEWPEPEAIGYEIAAYGVFEPHGTAHPKATQPSSAIHWIGQERPMSVSDLNDILKVALWDD